MFPMLFPQAAPKTGRCALSKQRREKIQASGSTARVSARARGWGTEKLFFTRVCKSLPPDAPQTDLYQKARVYRHMLGTNPDADKTVFGFDVNPNVTFDQKMLPFVATDPNWKYAFAFINSGVSPNNEIYIAPLETMSQNTIPWRKIVSLADEVSSFDLRGDDLYLTTYKNTPRYKIVRTSLKQPDLSKAEIFFRAAKRLSKARRHSAMRCMCKRSTAGSEKSIALITKPEKGEPLSLPFEGSAYINATDTNTDGIYLGIESWTKSNTHFRYDPKTGAATNTNLVPPITVDMSGVEFINTKAKSYDGTLVPLVIIYKKGLKRDGTNPVLMNGYGAYGYENTSAFFYPNILPWLDRGGVFVFAGIRGGGEYGEEWHLAGKGATKPNTWKDFIACAEYLIAEKYTSATHLGIQGGSAGGILISNTIATRPELFGGNRQCWAERCTAGGNHIERRAEYSRIRNIHDRRRF